MYKKFTRFFCTPSGYMHKFLLIMKLTTLLLIVTLVQVSAAGFAQKVTYTQKNATLEQLIKEIRVQTGYNVIVSADNSRNIQPMDVNFKNTPLTDVLDRILKDQPLSYEIKDKLVIIKEKEASLLDKLKNALTPNAPPADVTGRVTNKAGEPLSGATVTIKRTKTGVVTDANGRFSLKGLDQNDILVFSFIGYKTLEVKIGTQTVFNETLEEATNALDQVVVQAYGETSQRLNTGDIGVIRAATIEKQPVMNPLLTLEGQVPGLDIVQQSGYASAPVKVEIRGRANIGNSLSDPLYVIDGVPLTINDVNGSGAVSRGFNQTKNPGPANGQSPLFSINPADIESISVLKDAVATSIYGSRGAQGVILITTKKGQAGKTKFDASVEDGIEEVSKFYPLLNTQQYLAVRREAYKNDGLTPQPGDAPDLLLWDPNKNTNWEKTLYGKYASDTKAQLALSGGDAQTTFRISAGYEHSNSITTVSGADQRASASFDLTHKSVNQRFSVELQSQYTYSLSDLVQLPGSITFPPNTPPIYDSQGHLNYAGWAPVSYLYPFGTLLRSYSATTNFLNGKLSLNFQPFHGFNIKADFGYNYAQANQKNSTPIASQDPSANPLGQSFFGYNNVKNWIIEPQITYDAAIGKGKLSALAGASLQSSFTDAVSMNGLGYTNDALLSTITDAATVVASDDNVLYKFAAIFGRINYSWEDKYIIDLSARRDGSSKFGPGNRFGNFAAVGAAWIFTEEAWVKNNVSLLSFGKLRASYGSTGGDGSVSNYEYLSRYSASGFPPYGGVVPLQPTQLANPNYHWQVNDKLEIALELGFLKDRITLSADYYRDRTDNQLVQYPLPSSAGFNQVIANLPALVQNSGWEFSLQTKVIDAADFKWSFNFNIGFNHNKLLAFPNLAQSSYAGQYFIGQPLNILRLLHFTGVDPLTGQYTYQDKNNDGTITNYLNYKAPNDDRYIYNLTPPFFGGFGTNANYKNISISLFFNFKKQVGPNLNAQGYGAGQFFSNQPIYVVGREWQKPGDVTDVARYTTGSANSDSYLHSSDAGYTDASFIRLKNLQVSYDLPTTLVKKLGMRRCSVFFRGQNLFVITPYKGVDPETQDYNGLPPTKAFTGGLSFNF
ncbi:TonB-dependent receptor [Mucilaginibacter sp. BJC16-A38]|uniref:TonB-dependent receptor n=1 Tax=Mucilaginibacter phenanthrenivorans TaxID=1234842 RepID=UPI0021574B68|nr:TonB-dependent receptor [Mucilaginibacter phenanthrenivorans]MCR8556964.1 TonB-dependent receptor [Mucilaginibacter phenanthrenivorans]